MVCLLPCQQDTLCTDSELLVRKLHSSPWSSTGFSAGAAPVYHLPSTSWQYLLTLWHQLSLLCWWHSDLCVHQAHFYSPLQYPHCLSPWSSSMDDKQLPKIQQLLLIGNKPTLSKINVCSIPISDSTIPVSTQVKSLGVILDHTLSFSSHINNVSRIAFFHLRNISWLLPVLTQHSTEVLVNALVPSRIDYCNAILLGIPNKNQLQLIQNAAAQIISQSKSTKNVTSLLIQLHWLPVSQQITFKILLLIFKALHNISPLTSRTCFQPTPPLAPCDLHQQVYWHHQLSNSAQWVPGLSPKMHPHSGTPSRLISAYWTPLQNVILLLKHIFLNEPTN